MSRSWLAMGSRSYLPRASALAGIQAECKQTVEISGKPCMQDVASANHASLPLQAVLVTGWNIWRAGTLNLYT